LDAGYVTDIGSLGGDAGLGWAADAQLVPGERAGRKTRPPAADVE
jgi:hypothetical protein